ncbi:MAG: hypothetical protein EA362_08150 [Saprospirales bacterium]|nr:MAG: hypothetical protein EA362_08150 [Saprospirales bacterium]
MVVFLFSSTVSFSQEYTGLFNYIQPPQELDSLSTITLEKIIADSTVVSYHFVTVNPIEHSVVDFKIPINFPQGEINHGTHLFEYNHVEFITME